MRCGRNKWRLAEQRLTAVVLGVCNLGADLDSTAVDCLMELRHSLQTAGNTLLLARSCSGVWPTRWRRHSRLFSLAF